ncbi:MAG: PAS domain S-box protein [Methylotenera sp.]|nr:PAS domain S-box protein [Oligoflexia bacterium]
MPSPEVPESLLKLTPHFSAQAASQKALSRLLFAQSFGLVLLLAGSAWGVRQYLKWIISSGPAPQAQALESFDRFLMFSILILSVGLCLFAVWAWRSLILPLRVQMAASVESIRADLEHKTESLSLEREQLSTLMSAISDAILAIDLEEAPLFFNGQFALLMGRENLRNQDFRLWEMFRDPEILGVFRVALQKGRVVHLKATPFDQETGRKFYSLSVSPLRRPDRTIYGAVGIFHDVTELKTAEQMRIDFVANVSHELRTPLTAIKGYADTLVQDLREGRAIAPEFLDIILRNVDRLMNLISDLLDLSTLDAASDGLQKEKLPTEDLSHRVVAQMALTLEAKKQTVKIESRVPLVTADLRRIEQVLVNLLDNAAKYTPVGGSISIFWEKDSGSADTLLRVVDAGPGIDPDHHQRLFERFYRVDKARSRELGGTGLGLAIVKHIMQRHGGAVWVKSELGRGAQFICRFPAS